jgi:hypothetical protein
MPPSARDELSARSFSLEDEDEDFGDDGPKVPLTAKGKVVRKSFSEHVAQRVHLTRTLVMKNADEAPSFYSRIAKALLFALGCVIAALPFLVPPAAIASLGLSEMFDNLHLVPPTNAAVALCFVIGGTLGESIKLTTHALLGGLLAVLDLFLMWILVGPAVGTATFAWAMNTLVMLVVALVFEVPPVMRTFFLLWVIRYFAHAEKHYERTFAAIINDEIHVFVLTAFGGLIAIVLTSVRRSTKAAITGVTMRCDELCELVPAHSQLLFFYRWQLAIGSYHLVSFLHLGTRVLACAH